MATKPMYDNTPEAEKASTDETAQTQNDAIAADGGRPIRHHVDEVVLAIDSHNPLLHLHAADDAADDATPRCGGAPGASRNGNTTRYRSADVQAFPVGYREWCDDCVAAFYDAQPDVDADCSDERLIADGGEEVKTEWTLTCLDCEFSGEMTEPGHPRDGPPKTVEKAVTKHKHVEDESHVVRVAGRRVDRDDSIDPSLVADGGSTWRDLTGFQRDLLEAIQRLEHDGVNPSGQEVKVEAETMLREDVNHGRLYPNLDALVEAGLVEKGSIDRRTNAYHLTPTARAMVRDRVQRLASAFDKTAMADGGRSE
jgi:hypothetical protein